MDSNSISHPMKTIYAVSSGYYDDHEIRRLYKNLTTAEAFCEEQNKIAYQYHLAYIERQKNSKRGLSSLDKIYKDIEDFIKNSYDNFYIEEFEYNED